MTQKCNIMKTWWVYHRLSSGYHLGVEMDISWASYLSRLQFISWVGLCSVDEDFFFCGSVDEDINPFGALFDVEFWVP